MGILSDPMPDKEKIELDYLFKELAAERAYQVEMWGDEFDKKNTPNDWIAYIARYVGQAVTKPWSANQFRKQLMKVATLCLSAVLWCDKTGGKMPKRHYD